MNDYNFNILLQIYFKITWIILPLFFWELKIKIFNLFREEI